jgi:hypothetical protein
MSRVLPSPVSFVLTEPPATRAGGDSVTFSSDGRAAGEPKMSKGPSSPLRVQSGALCPRWLLAVTSTGPAGYQR